MRIAFALTCLCITFSTVGCGDDRTAPKARVTERSGDDVRFGEADEVVVTPNGTYVVERNGSDEPCVDIDGTCIALEDVRGRHCDDPEGQADVAVVDGEAVVAVCFPDDEGGVELAEATVDGDGGTVLPQNANGRVIVFAQETNGQVIEGDVELKGERTVIYGNGVDETIIGGNLVVSSNNARVRGLTVRGDLTVGSNGVGLSHCRIHGDLRVTGNGFTALGCEVLGDVEISGNGATVAHLDVAGAWSPGRDTVCHEIHAFSDDDGDLAWSAGERGAALTCGRP